MIIRAEVFEYEEQTGRGLFLIHSGARTLGLLRLRPSQDELPFNLARHAVYLCGSGCLQATA